MIKYNRTLAMFAALCWFHTAMYIFLAAFLGATWLMYIGTPDNNFGYYLLSLVHLVGAAFFAWLGAWFWKLKKVQLERKGESA